MKYTDEELKVKLGLDDLDQETASQMLATFYETLDMRIGAAIADRLNDEQLAKFESLKESGEDDGQVDEWLHAAIPNYESLLDEEADKLLEEIDSSASSITQNL